MSISKNLLINEDKEKDNNITTKMKLSITFNAANVENYCLIKSLHKQAIIYMIVKLEKVKRKVEIDTIAPKLIQSLKKKKHQTII